MNRMNLSSAAVCLTTRFRYSYVAVDWWWLYCSWLLAAADWSARKMWSSVVSKNIYWQYQTTRELSAFVYRHCDKLQCTLLKAFPEVTVSRRLARGWFGAHRNQIYDLSTNPARSGYLFESVDCSPCFRNCFLEDRSACLTQDCVNFWTCSWVHWHLKGSVIYCFCHVFDA